MRANNYMDKIYRSGLHRRLNGQYSPSESESQEEPGKPANISSAHRHFHNLRQAVA
jgi:hypothetical protein